MQFQFTLDKLKQCLAESGARQALYETAEEYANCKPSERNRGIIKKYIDEALDGKVDTQNTGDESLDFDISEAEKQLQAEKSELEHKVQELQTMLTDAKSKIDLDATNRSEMQADLDEKVKQLENLNSVLDDLHKRLQATEEERDSLEKEELLAFGDGENDIKMFETVGTSVAMGNANDKVKSIATYTTLSNEEDGIVHGLENIVNHLL